MSRDDEVERLSAGAPSDEQSARVQAQLDLILGPNGVDDAEVVLRPPRRTGGADGGDGQGGDGGTPEVLYIARRDHLLVRRADLALVASIVPGRLSPIARRDDDGLALFELTVRDSAAQEPPITNVESALRVIDRELGPGVATPDHFLHVSPSTGGHCPATEPETVRTPTRPYPIVECTCCGAGHAGRGRGVSVWILDSGLLGDATATHPWMSNVQAETADVEDPYVPGSKPSILPYAGHGTFSAGVLAAIAPDADVRVRQTFTRVTQGGDVRTKTGLYESELLEHVQAALDGGANIISLSFGTHSRDNIPLLSIDALEPLIRAHEGVILVAAAGNDTTSDPFWPAAYPWVVSVGALGRNWDDLAWFTNFGPWVQVYAPGEDLVNAYVSNGTFTCVEAPHAGEERTFRGMARWSGTSFSTPLVAGLIARRMSETGESARCAADVLLTTAQRIPGVGPVLLPQCGGTCCRSRCC